MAAGLGYKEFTTGDVLTAADANGYLASQVVMVFADSAARTAAIASPEEGMISYLKDTNSTEYYSGAAWVAVGGASGKVLQVVQGTTSSVVTTTSTSYVTTGLSASITPSSASNKVLAFYVVNFGTAIADYFLRHTLFRGTVAGTNLASDCFGNMQATAASLRFNQSVQYLDSPNTTSATTYTVGFKVENTQTGTVTTAGAGVVTSVLILMEISA